ncbi:MAG: acyl-homoserine-lactone synthase [Candidatus Aquicultor sp.]|nr:acyl-homoserine-lactone synthase [Candidatus Aquicultor sp.]
MTKSEILIQRIKTLASKPLMFRESSFTVRTLDPENPADVLKYQELRYQLRVVKYQWLTAPEPGRSVEYDEYDPFSIPFGVFAKDGELHACSRLILPSDKAGLQIFNEFRDNLYPDFVPAWKSASSAEVSSLLVSDSFTHPHRNSYPVAQWLYKAMGQWSISNRVRYWYAVAEKRFLRALGFQGFPFKIIGEGKHYKGALTYPAVLDLEQAYANLMKREGDVYKWFLEGLDFRGKGDPPKIL